MTICWQSSDSPGFAIFMPIYSRDSVKDRRSNKVIIVPFEQLNNTLQQINLCRR
ncbi:MAG: phycobilisome linker polypeptide [Microcystaceae cyanobacterium]